MFICFEGIAGSGKTTQTKLLADYLKDVKEKEVFISAAYEGERREAVSDFMNIAGIKSAKCPYLEHRYGSIALHHPGALRLWVCHIQQINIFPGFV